VAGRRARARRPSSPRSQHFLRSAVAAEIVRGACLRGEELVLDLGAGSGRLTAELARAAERVVAIELDPQLAALLRGRWTNVEVVASDAVTFPLPAEPFRVVANIPFARTADILHHLLDDPLTPLVRADLVVEWGVALKRGIPWPSTVHGVRWGAFYELAVTRRLPRQAFEPPPATDAGVLVATRRAQPLVPVGVAAAYGAFVARGFRHGLGAVASPRALRRLGVTTARELDAHQWATLFGGS
jgi:23S rRNA (adenine-N6)-dimethyltransferase